MRAHVLWVHKLVERKLFYCQKFPFIISTICPTISEPPFPCPEETGDNSGGSKEQVADQCEKIAEQHKDSSVLGAAVAVVEVDEMLGGKLEVQCVGHVSTHDVASAAVLNINPAKYAHSKGTTGAESCAIANTRSQCSGRKWRVTQPKISLYKHVVPGKSLAVKGTAAADGWNYRMECRPPTATCQLQPLWKDVMQYGKHEDSYEISYQVMAPLQLSSP